MQSIPRSPDRMEAEGKVIERLNQLLEGSGVSPYKLQVAISLRIIPRVHGHIDALDQVRSGIEQTISTFLGNPMLVEDDGEGQARLLSVGSFHNQLLINLIEYLAIATSHVVCLSERRLHRMMDETKPALTLSRLPTRIGRRDGSGAQSPYRSVARVRMAAQPLSLMTSETSGGQEEDICSWPCR